MQAKREQVKVNFTKINVFLKGTNQDGTKQVLIDWLEHPDMIIPLEFDDAAFNRTKEILKIIVPQCIMFEGETPAQQATLARKFIRDCMTYLLSTPDKIHRTKFDTLPEESVTSDLIEQFADNPRVTEVSKSTHGFFKRTVELQELLHAVVWSDAEEKAPNKVADILKDHPELLFQKGQITREGIKTSRQYRIDFMSKNQALENVIYIRAIDNKVSYSLITPTGVKIENILTNIDAPTPFTITDELTKAILNDTTNAGYTPTLYEQTYYDVSPFQLILFSGDMYLLEKIKPFITEENRKKAQKQCNELKGGGSDLVKLGILKEGNRIKGMRELSYGELTQFVEKHANGQPKQEEVENGLMRNITSTLQENKDAIVLYNDNYYYVRLNHETKTVEKIEPITFITNNEQAQNKLASLFIQMEINSGRRSKNQEHRLIETNTTSTSNPAGIQLERKGLRYKRGDDDYQDCKAESLILQALRKCRRLWDEAVALDANPNTTDEARFDSWNKADEARLDAGKAQATDTADKLLLYCIKNMPTYPVPDFKVMLGAATQNLKREFKFDSFIKNYLRGIGIYSGGNLFIGLNFSLIKTPKGGMGVVGARLGRAPGDVAWTPRRLDLAVFRRYDEISRADVDEFTKSLDVPIRNHVMKH